MSCAHFLWDFVILSFIFLELPVYTGKIRSLSVICFFQFICLFLFLILLMIVFFLQAKVFINI